MGEELSPSLLDQWSKDFEEVRESISATKREKLIYVQSPTLPLARLVLSKSDPLQSLSVRNAIVDDAKIFNLQLKGVNSKGEYPGPRVNQAASGRCWLFATSELVCRVSRRLSKLNEDSQCAPIRYHQSAQSG